MGKSQFTLNPFPIQYRAKYSSDNIWEEEYKELPNKGSDESKLPEDERNVLIEERNYANDLPLINFTTQYALSCFEGLKVYPQAHGGLSLFRVDKNALRFYNSMQGLSMPPYPVDMFIHAVKQVVLRSHNLGFTIQFNQEWIKTQFSSAKSIYIRPFSYSEGGIGVNPSLHPWVIMMASEVGNYFETCGCPTLMVSKKIRATPNGTGWIKCSSNYVISMLAKTEAQQAGYLEALFLDPIHQKYAEECSSCNIFFILGGTIVTPPLSDTILPGITRDSVITLAQDLGYTVEERNISIEEILDSATECFSTGTAVGITYFGKIVYNGVSTQFSDGKIGETTYRLQKTLKNLQHGLYVDTHSWLIPIST